MTQLEPKRLHPTRLAQSEMARNQWNVSPEYGTPYEALLDPAYWAHVSAKLRRGDIITALSEDNSYFAEYIVLEPDKLRAEVALLTHVDLAANSKFNAEVPKGFEIKFRGPCKWSVLRGTDVLKEGMTRKEADAWLKDHVRTAA